MASLREAFRDVSMWAPAREGEEPPQPNEWHPDTRAIEHIKSLSHIHFPQCCLGIKVNQLLIHQSQEGN